MQVQTLNMPCISKYRYITIFKYVNGYHTYFGSGESGMGFMESLHNERKTRKASFWSVWDNLAVMAASPSVMMFMLSCEGTLVMEVGVWGALEATESLRWSEGGGGGGESSWLVVSAG